MFDVGFFELLLLGLVALLVVGPERLPKLAYTAGKWLGKGRSMINSVKLEIDKEIKA
ncbi:MAG: twin arginine-targeting protein translocase TatB, partial [Candidatus Sedimenticola endophacoides]